MNVIQLYSWVRCGQCGQMPLKERYYLMPSIIFRSVAICTTCASIPPLADHVLLLVTRPISLNRHLALDDLMYSVRQVSFSFTI